MRKAISFSVLMVLMGLLVAQIGCSKDEDPVTPPPTCSITLTSPKANDSFFTDDEINIRWDRDTSENVKIVLFKGGVEVGTIRADHTNTGTDGFYPWLTPETFGQDSGEDYSIKVTSLKNPDCSDQTGDFEIIDVSNCFIKFPWTEKDSIPDLRAGSDFLISWDSAHTSGMVDLELWYEPFTQVGTLVGIIAQDLNDTGSYMWTVDSFHRGTDGGYRFKIRDVSAHRCTDTSVRFNLIDEVNCSIDVLGISEGHIYDPDDVANISFTFENSSGVVDLRLYSGNIPVTNGNIVDGFDTLNGTVLYNWTVTDFGHAGPAFNRYNIRAMDSDDNYCFGKSSEFTITQ